MNADALRELLDIHEEERKLQRQKELLMFNSGVARYPKQASGNPNGNAVERFNHGARETYVSAVQQKPQQVKRGRLPKRFREEMKRLKHNGSNNSDKHPHNASVNSSSTGGGAGDCGQPENMEIEYDLISM
ncbi:unnamed protein product [Sympodiomycopsis kandeliae]